MQCTWRNNHEFDTCWRLWTATERSLWIPIYWIGWNPAVIYRLARLP